MFAAALVFASAPTSCLEAFKECEADCHASSPDAQICVHACAKTSALCQARASGDGPIVLDMNKTSVIASTTPPFSDASGELYLPFGFYQYTVTSNRDKLLPVTEASYGMNLACPYASTASPDELWFKNMENFMDASWQAGFQIHFQLIAFETLGNNASVLGNLTAIVKRFKKHPALMAWYLADEPGGQGIDPKLLKPKYDAIKAADPDHLVTMVFCTSQAKLFIDSLDIIMVDPYPVPGNKDPASSVEAALSNVAGLGKPIILVPQAFGGGENWARAPSAEEERVMTYVGLLRGVVGIQYFVRSVHVFPYASYAWSEIRKVAAEVKELTPALLSGQTFSLEVQNEHSPLRRDCKVEAGGWVDRDGSVVVVAVARAAASGAPCEIKISPSDKAGGWSPKKSELGRGDAAATVYRVEAIFEGGGREIMARCGEVDGYAFSDSLRAYATAVYRISPITALAAPTTNLVYNPSYEINVNPSTPDGNYPSQPASDAAFFFADSRLSVDGRHSLHLHAPSDGNGTTLAPYPIAAAGISTNATFNFSVWSRGSVAGGERVDFVFSRSMWRLLVPGVHNASVTPSTNTIAVTAQKQEWTKSVAQLLFVGDPKKACPYNCRGWMSYSLQTKGDVFLDSLSLIPAK